jgi:hypothetical protein
MSLESSARGAGAVTGFIQHRDKKKELALAKAKEAGSMTPLIELAMTKNRVGAFTRSVRDTITEQYVDDTGKRKMRFRPEFLTLSSRGPEEGAPDFLKLSNVIFQKALDSGLYPTEYKDFVEAYGETYKLPAALTTEMLKSKYLDALVKRQIALLQREADSIIQGADTQLARDSSLTESNKGLIQSFTELSETPAERGAAQIQALLSGTALPSGKPTSRSDVGVIALLAETVSRGGPDAVHAQAALEAINESKKSGSLLAGLGGRFGKPTAGERGKVIDQQSLINAGKAILGRASPEQLQTGHQLGLTLTRFSQRIKDLKLVNVPIGKALSKGAEFLAETQGIPVEKAQELERDFQLVQNPATIMRTAFRRAWTGVAFRREEMKDYEKALPTMEKDDWTTFVTKVEDLVNFTEDAQLRLVAMMLDGVVSPDQIAQKKVPESMLFDNRYYITPLATTNGIKGRYEGATRVISPRLKEIDDWLKLQGKTPEQFLKENNAIPYIGPDYPAGGEAVVEEPSVLKELIEEVGGPLGFEEGL